LQETATLRPEREWVDNIKVDITEIRWDGLECINLAQDRSKWLAITNTVKKFRVAQKAGNLSNR
jgi:hypothetical protein